MKRMLLLVAALVLLSGCTSLGRLDKDATLSSDQKSVFVIGVAPPNFRISVFPGELRKGVFHQNLFSPAAVFGAAQGGYVVGEASKGETLAITNVRVVADKNSLLGADFGPCDGARAITFAVPGGKVIYLGDIRYRFDGQRLLVNYHRDLAAAKRYIDRTYPHLAGRLENWSFRMLPTAASCTRTIYVPVYVPTK